MAYTVTEIDKYLASKKYPFFKLITKEWGKDNKEEVNEIKSLWNDAQKAVSTNDKIEKFEKLNSKLRPLFDSWKKQIAEDDEYLAKYKKDTDTKAALKVDSEKIISENINLTLSKNAEIVYNSINIEFFTIDDLGDTGLSVGDIFSAVTELELSGLVRAVPGGRYSKTK